LFVNQKNILVIKNKNFKIDLQTKHFATFFLLTTNGFEVIFTRVATIFLEKVMKEITK
jgi:hypothetical protein